MSGDGANDDQTETLFLAFCITKKRQQEPTNWRMSEDEETNQIENFERFRIFEISCSSVQGHVGDYLVVHGLCLDVSKYIAGSKIKETVSKRVVYSFIRREDAEFQNQMGISKSSFSSSKSDVMSINQTSLVQARFFE